MHIMLKFSASICLPELDVSVFKHFAHTIAKIKKYEKSRFKMQEEIKKSCFKHKNSISGLHHSSVFNYREHWKQYLIS